MGGTLCLFLARNSLASSSSFIVSDPFKISEVGFVEPKLPVSVLRGVFTVRVADLPFAKVFVSLFESVQLVISLVCVDEEYHQCCYEK